MTERRLFGRAASPGLVSGPVVLLEAVAAHLRAAGSPVEEARALRQAIAAALVEARAEFRKRATELLEFQVEMLADDETPGAALHAIARGAGAHAAWTAAMEDEIEGYRRSDDTYFTTRAAGLERIRDRVLRHLGPGAADLDTRVLSAPQERLPPGAVIVAADLPPARFAALDWSGGGAIVLMQGSPSGPLATLARARGVAMVVRVGDLPGGLAGQEALVDGDAGDVVLSPGEAACAAYLGRRSLARNANRPALWRDHPAVTEDGTRIALQITLGSLTELDGLDPRFCDGIGRVHSDALCDAPEDEAAQYAAYCRLGEWAAGRVITVCAHGHTSFRALARAAVHGAIRIMLPMASAAAELEAARRMLDAAMASLADAGVRASRPPLGIMVAVPAAAIAVDRFDADFFSIDLDMLTHYVTAGRQADPRHPAVLRLLAAVAQHARSRGREVSLCGGDPAMVGHLLHAGMRTLSVPPQGLARMKRAIEKVDLSKQGKEGLLF